MVTETTKNEKPLVRENNHSEVSLEVWQDYFSQLYSERNKDFTPEVSSFIWLKVIEKATVVGESIRKKKFNDASKALARVFCWLCGFCTKNSDMLETNSLSEIVWYKYPKICSTCAQELDTELMRELENKKALKCRCDQNVEDISGKHVNNEILEEYRRLDKPIKLDEWVDMFRVIYGHRLHLQSLDSICFHFVEEVGEVTTALRNYRELEINIDPKNVERDKILKLMDPVRKNDTDYDLLKTKEENDEVFFAGCRKILKDSIKEELADVFSWLCALIIKLLESRKCYTDYEKRFIRKLDKDGPMAKLLKFYEEKPLKLSSIIYLEYIDGCPVCKNLKNEKGSKCICDTKMSPTII